MQLTSIQISKPMFNDWFDRDVPSGSTPWMIVTDDGEHFSETISGDALLAAWEALEFEDGIHLVQKHDDDQMMFAFIFPVGMKKAKRQKFLDALSDTLQ